MLSLSSLSTFILNAYVWSLLTIQSVACQNSFFVVTGHTRSRDCQARAAYAEDGVSPQTIPTTSARHRGVQLADESVSEENEDNTDDEETVGVMEEGTKVPGENARLGWLDRLRSVFGFAATRRENTAYSPSPEHEVV